MSTLPLFGLIGAAATLTGGIAFPAFGAILLTWGKGLVGWLSKRSLAELACIGLAVALLLAVHNRNHWKAADERDRATAANYRRQLDAISTKRNEQAKVTERTVEKVIKGDPVVRTVVQHIHDAPNPPDCETPDLETLRNVL